MRCLRVVPRHWRGERGPVCDVDLLAVPSVGDGGLDDGRRRGYWCRCLDLRVMLARCAEGLARGAWTGVMSLPLAVSSVGDGRLNIGEEPWVNWCPNWILRAVSARVTFRFLDYSLDLD